MTSDTQPALRVKWMEGTRARDALAEVYAVGGADGALDVLWEPADVQWWWSTCPPGDWPAVAVALDAADRPVIASLLMRGRDAWTCALAWLRRPDRGSRKVVAMMAGAAVEQARELGRPLRFVVHERDEWLSRCLEGMGLVYDDSATVVQYAVALRGAVEALPLPDGYRLADDCSRPPAVPHPLARRNGAGIAARLGECPHYRRELDLAIVDERDAVAAYGVVWFDPARGVALVEPVRTEEGHQRRGLARVLLRAGLARAQRAGARWVKVSAHTANPAACALVETSGFTPVLRKLSFQFSPG